METRDQPTLAQQAEFDEQVADRAVELARYAESIGHFDGADILWDLSHRCRVQAMKLRALSEAEKKSIALSK